MIYAQMGSRGSNVTKIQGKLGVTTDGVFGKQTQQAVMEFQRSRGLKTDGIVGSKTWGAMFGGGSSVGSSNSGVAFGTGGAGGFMDKIIGGVLLYGFFKVLMKVF